MHLTRSHGLGNDYLVADPADLPVPLSAERVRLICDRHRGVGSDGILLLDGAFAEGWRLRILNPDGSEAEKSGNGIRIFAKWLVDTGRSATRSFLVRTLGGDVPVTVDVANGRGRAVTADMGKPAFRADLTRLDIIDGRVVALSIGNPHCVVLRERLDVDELRRVGPLIERHPAFPHRTNVQLAHVVDRQRVEALIWERGAGETLASGSSACAVAAACHRLGLVDRDLSVSMQGGELAIRLDADGHVWMHGPVEEIAEVRLSSDLIARLRALP